MYETAYQRAADAIAILERRAVAAHAALFDFAGELGKAAGALKRHDDPLALHVRFVRKPPPRLDAPTGVIVEDADKERAPGFAAVVLAAQDLWLEIRSDPGVAVDAVTNVAALAPFAAAVRGIVEGADGRAVIVHAAPLGTVEAGAFPATPAAVLHAFLEAAADVFATRANYNGAPTTSV